MTSEQTIQQLADAGIRLDDEGAVLRVTLDQPDRRNAQTPATWRALAALGDDLPETTRVVILSGAGPAFSAGLDRRMFAEGIDGEPSLATLAHVDDATFDAQIAEYQRAFTWWRRRPVVTIAAVAGHAVGAGFQLALGCDLMVVADNAMLSMKEVQLGLVPDLAGTWPLAQAVGQRRALEICLTGRPVSGREAADIGLALTCVERDALTATADDLAAAIVASAPGATTEVLALLRGVSGRDHEEHCAAERKAQRVRISELAALLNG